MNGAASNRWKKPSPIPYQDRTLISLDEFRLTVPVP
jgi:hypothetical protein